MTCAYVAEHLGDPDGVLVAEVVVARRRHGGRSRVRREVSGWHFWRRVFWTRPALLVFYGVAIGVFLLWALAVTVPSGVRDAIAMRDATLCPLAPIRAEADVDPPRGCLERVPVFVSGPHGRKLRDGWVLCVPQEGRLVPYARTDVPIFADGGLSDGARADALLWEGTPVVLELSTGERIETADWGHRRWALMVAFAMFFAAIALMLFDAGRYKRRTASGWWSVDGQPGLASHSMTLEMVAILLFLTAALVAVPLLLGLHLGWAAAVAAVCLGWLGWRWLRTRLAARASA